MSALDTLIWKLTHEDHLAAVEKNRSRLEWAANITKETSDDDEMWLCLKVILLYVKKHKQCPPNLAAVNDFIQAEDSNEAWELTRSREVIRGALVGLKDRMADRKVSSKDIAILIDSAVRDARKEFHRLIGLRYADIVSNGPSQAGKDHVPSGPNDAMAFARQLWGFDLIEEGGIGGWVGDHKEVIGQYIFNVYRSNDKDRVLLGFRQIDDCVLVGKKHNKFLGILGFSNEGKSLLMRTIAYNAAIQGQKVLYVTLEGEDAAKCMVKFSFLHGSYFELEGECLIHDRCAFTMPAFEDYEMKQVTEQDHDHVNLVLNTLDQLPLHVYDRKTLGDWDAIEAKVEQEKFDVVCIDYVGILDMPNVKPKDRDFAIEVLYDRAQSLCGRLGVVVVTPLQSNREGKKQAENKEKIDRIYNMTHVAKHSRAYQNMDLLLAVYSTPEMKQVGEIKIEILKVRDGKYPDDFFADVNVSTKHVTQLPNAAGRFGKDFLPTLPEPKMPDLQKFGDENLAERNDWIDEALM